MTSVTEEIERFGLRTMVDVLRHRARYQSDETAFVFLRDGELDELRMTYAELDGRARRVAAALQEHVRSAHMNADSPDDSGLRHEGLDGARVLLLYPPGLDYIAAFFGCLYAGAIAVPAYPPEPGRIARTLPRIRAIAADCDARLALTAGDLGDLASALEGHAAELGRLAFLAPDQTTAAVDCPPLGPSPESLAFLQYTSGSTSTPKGVMVSHGNLMANQKMLAHALGTNRQSVGAGWLPLYHDMGLIGQIMNPLYCGFPVTLMSPLHFLQSPLRWLRVISRCRATVSSAPNFAYDLCVQKYERALAAGRAPVVDLGSWTAALNGAEPVRAETLDAFARCFRGAGFRREAFVPCYGLAEATLIVSGSAESGSRSSAAHAPGDRVTLRAGAQPLVGCGAGVVDQELQIVDPERQCVVPEGALGEIWVAGPHVAKGYWNRPEQSEETFGARIEGRTGGPFLRTGDLGLLRNGSLYVAGRRKDLIILRGRNVYPQDVEFTVEKCHPSVREAGVAAFAVAPSGEEELAVAVEVRQTSEQERHLILEAVRRAVLRDHDVDVAGIVLLRPGALPKTSSGKIQRHAARAAYVENGFNALLQWRRDVEAHAPPVPTEVSPPRGEVAQAPERRRIQTFIVEQLAELCNRAPETFDPNLPFVCFGLDSKRAVALSGAVEEFVGRRVNPTVAYEYPTIAKLSAYLAGEPADVSGVLAPQGLGGTEAIAIVGVACRFPGAESPEELWSLLQQGKHAVRDVPNERCNLGALYSPEGGAGKSYTRRAALLEDVERFDPEFFGISRVEARAMDPLQRLLLEVTWEALCDAGQAPDGLNGSSTGVFVGASNNEYAALRMRNPAVRLDGYSTTGSLSSTLAGRLSYTLGLNGPSMVVDTACSSSLLAVHLACQSLRNGECEMALAAGGSLILLPESFVALSATGALSRDGRCRPFEAKADGYGRGEGCAVVVLKRLSDALAAGEPVLAVILGSAVNQDGRSNGLTAPSKVAQSQVLRAALANAGLRPTDVGYVEAHGTGTPLGDPIEVAAIDEVYGRDRSKDAPLLLGSVKANVGHLEAAAGIAGLVKALLVVRHGVVPAQPEFGDPSSLIHWQELNLRVPTRPEALEVEPTRPRLAAVSAFGMTGTNVHLVLGEAPAASPEVAGADAGASHGYGRLPLLRLTARSSAALQTLAGRFAAQLRTAFEDGYGEFVAAANLGQADHPHRASILAASRGDLIATLDALSARATSEPPECIVGHVERGATLPVAFLFTGQGAQYPDMGRQLFESNRVFRSCLLECERLLEPVLDRRLLSVMYPENEADRVLLEQTRYAQPALFALEYALALMLRSCGVVPDVVIGHSLGELVAAAVAGVMSMEDGLKLAAARGELTQRLAGQGAMLSVSADPGLLVQMIEACQLDVTLAAVNAAERVTLSGPTAAIEAAWTMLEARAIPARRLTGSRAFHSPMMLPVLDAYRSEVERVRLHVPKCRVISALTGQEERELLCESDYWVRQLHQPVRFDRALAAAAAKPVGVWLELGPRTVLLPFVRLQQPDGLALRLPTLQPEVSDPLRIGQTLAALYANGVALDWRGVSGMATRHVFLPSYPWQRERCWFDAPDITKPEQAVAVQSQSRVAPVQGSHQAISERLRVLVATLLECKPASVGLRTPLVDLGADSILLIEGVQRIEREFGVRLRHEDLFQRYSTIELLAQHLTQHAGHRSSEPSGVEAAPVLEPVAPLPSPPSPRVSQCADLTLANSLLTPAQHAHLQVFQRRYEARTKGSKARQVSAKPQLVDTRASVGFRTTFPDALRARWLHTKEIAYPIVGARSKGSKIWDVDGNEYVDLAMGFGVHLFGHSPSFIVEALQRQLERGMHIGPQAELAETASSLISELTGVSRVAFCSSGTEAVMTALRVARAATGRPKIAVFAGSYHGSFDGVLSTVPLTLGSPPGIEHDVVVLEYGAPSALETLRERAEEFAGVLVEPVQSRRPEFQPREFLQQLRALTREAGIALIFDEVLVGFRIHLGGAQAWFGIEADIVTYGKIAGGGMPIGVVSGRAEFLDVIDGGAWQYGDASAPSRDQIWFAGTFNKNPLTMAAAVAALTHLKEAGPALHTTLNRRADVFVEELNRFFANTSTEIQVNHFGSLLRFRVPRHLELFYHHLIARGVYIWEGRSSFLSTAHSDADLERVLDAVRASVKDLEQGGFVAQPQPRTSFIGTPAEPEPLRVFCFPDAGGSAQHYKRWARLLPDHVSLELVELPGRGAGEDAPRDFAELTRRVGEALLPCCDTPFAFLGHSMGALLAFEVARWMRREGVTGPRALFVSGEPAPQLQRPPLLSELDRHDDRALAGELSKFGVPRWVMEDHALIGELLPRLRADLALCGSYRYREEEPFDIPISAFAGQADPLATKAQMTAWAEQTHNEFSLCVLAGDHSFVRNQWKAICARLRRELDASRSIEFVRFSEHEEASRYEEQAPLSRPAA